MKATLRELWDSRKILEKLANQDFPIKVSYKLMKTIDGANKEILPFSRAIIREIWRKDWRDHQRQGREQRDFHSRNVRP
jgi:hypothetical protein